MSKCALHLALFTFAIATGYVTLVAVVTNIGSDLLSANLSHVNVWMYSCIVFLHFKQSAALCLVHVLSKKSFLLLIFFLTLSHGFAAVQCEDLFSGFSKYTRSLLV